MASKITKDTKEFLNTFILLNVIFSGIISLIYRDEWLLEPHLKAILITILVFGGFVLFTDIGKRMILWVANLF